MTEQSGKTEVTYEQQGKETQATHRRGTQGNISGNHSGKPRSRTYTTTDSEVQSLPEQNTSGTGKKSAYADMQTVSERDTERSSDEGGLRGVRAEIDGNILDEDAEQHQSRDYLDKTDLPKYSYDWFAAKPNMAKNKTNEPYIASFVVNRYTNELMDMDVLYAVNAKKEPAVPKAPRSTAKPLSVTDSTISISDLLDHVKGTTTLTVVRRGIWAIAFFTSSAQIIGNH